MKKDILYNRKEQKSEIELTDYLSQEEINKLKAMYATAKHREKIRKQWFQVVSAYYKKECNDNEKE